MNPIPLPSSIYVVTTDCTPPWLYGRYFAAERPQLTGTIRRLKHDGSTPHTGGYVVDHQSPRGKLTLEIEHLERVFHPHGFTLDLSVHVLDAALDRAPSPSTLLGLLTPESRLELLHHNAFSVGVVIAHAIPFGLPNPEEHTDAAVEDFYQSLIELHRRGRL